jgi:hypothetical protein
MLRLRPTHTAQTAEWYKFDGQEGHDAMMSFRSEVEFSDPPCITPEKVYVFSLSVHCYILNLKTSLCEEPVVEKVPQVLENQA